MNKPPLPNLQRPLQEVVSEAFAKYAKYIIQDRALPDLRDGLKPVQRRIIYTAYLNKLTANRPHKKSATLVGDVMGSFHPHGDSSIYDAIVRMCQPWKSNLSLLEMHGNVGSMDGDPAAAYRYTEIRLSAVSEWLLKNIDKETVGFMNNFDDTKKEPTVLPAQFFNLLINGASGISAGYATNIPPFNPNEVCQLLVKLIDHPELKINQITAILPAPDFPTGGTVEISNSLYEAYLTGRGKCSLFANYRVVKGKNHNQIIFDDVPFETNKGNIVKKIDDLITNHHLPHVLEVRDESGRDGISIVIDLAKNADPNLIIQYLFKNTDLRINFSINMVVIDQRKPKQLSLIQLFQSFLTHLQKVVISGFQYDQKQLVKRLEIVNGLLKSLKIIDDIIHLVRHSPNKETMVQKIIKTYDFTANQAEAIVSLQLYRLSNTDQKQLVEEKEEIEQKLHNLNELITNETTFKQHLKTQILTFANQFGYPRKTKIRHEPLHLNLNSKALIVDKKLCYLWMEPNQIKIVEDKKYQLTDLVNNKLKANQTYRDFQTINNKDQLLISTNLGNLILMAVHKLETKKMNMLPQGLDQIIPLDPHEKVVSVHPIDHTYSWTTETLVFLTQQGLGKKILMSEIVNWKRERFFLGIKLQNNDKLVQTIITTNPNNSVLCLTAQGYASHLLISEIRATSRQGKGQRAIKVKNQDYCMQLLLVPTDLDTYLVMWYQNGLTKIPFNQNNQLSKWSLTGKKLGPKKGQQLQRAWFAVKKDQLSVWSEENQPTFLPVSKVKSGEVDHCFYLAVVLTNYFATKLTYSPLSQN